MDILVSYIEQIAMDTICYHKMTENIIRTHGAMEMDKATMLLWWDIIDGVIDLFYIYLEKNNLIYHINYLSISHFME